MPELPEVEVSRRSLWRHMEGGTFLAPIVLRSDVIHVLSPNLTIDAIAGTQAVELKRRGKYLIWTLVNQTGERFLLIHHFRMTGSLLYDENAELEAKVMKHVHVIFPVIDKHSNRAYLSWHDIRRFGRLEWLREADFEASTHTIHSLGPEPFSDAFNAAYLKEQASRHKSLRLPAFFLNQQIVAGLGNIYVNEALFICRLHPELLAGKLSLRDCERLVLVFREILAASIRQGGTSFRNYRDGDGRAGTNQQRLLVYGRSGLACVRCNGKLESIKLGGRRTVFCPRCQKKKGKATMLFYASGYSNRELDQHSSVRAFSYDPNKGFLDGERLFPHLDNVSYIIQDGGINRLYGVTEAKAASVFALDLTNPDAIPDVRSIGGGGPCHLCTWGEYIITANYGSGTLSVLYNSKDGLKALGDIRHQGSGPNHERQDAPHAHWVGISSDQRYLLAVDLGCDRIFAYSLTELDAKLTPLRAEIDADTADANADANLIDQEIVIQAAYSSELPPGSGPRHLIASPDGKQIYVAGELSAELFVMTYDDGKLNVIQTLDISDSNGSRSSEETAPSAIRITADGRQVLIAVRGTDCLWSFTRDNDGKLRYADHQHIGDVWPRDFNLLPDQKTIVVACERSHALRAMSLDPKSGKLSRSDHRIDMNAPACILPI